MFEWFKRRRVPGGDDSERFPTIERLPTVRFDASLVSHSVKADLQQAVRSLAELNPGEVERVYSAALCAIESGGAQDVLYQALIPIEGMKSRRANEITRWLCNRASSMVESQRQLNLGINSAKWRIAGAPCGSAQQSASHEAANGKTFAIHKGMFLDGRWTWPGREEGCSCTSQPLIPGIDA